MFVLGRHSIRGTRYLVRWPDQRLPAAFTNNFSASSATRKSRPRTIYEDFGNYSLSPSKRFVKPSPTLWWRLRRRDTQPSDARDFNKGRSSWRQKDIVRRVDASMEGRVAQNYGEAALANKAKAYSHRPGVVRQPALDGSAKPPRTHFGPTYGWRDRNLQPHRARRRNSTSRPPKISSAESIRG